MGDTGQPKVISTAIFTSVRLIDGGDTVAISLLEPDGSEVIVLVPRKAAQVVQTHLAETLSLPLSRKHYDSDSH